MTIHVHPQRTSIFIFIFCGTKKCTILTLENVSIGIVATMIKTGCWGLSVLRVLTISCFGENQNKENEMFSDEISQQTFKFGLENSMATSAHDFTRKQSHPQAPNFGYFSSKCFITQRLRLRDWHLKNGISKSIAGLKKHANFQLYRVHPTTVIWKNRLLSTYICKNTSSGFYTLSDMGL